MEIRHNFAEIIIFVRNTITMSRLHGSQVNIQWSVNADRANFVKKILETNPDWEGGTIAFYSPLEKDDYEEYKGSSFIKGRIHNGSSFWEDMGVTCPEDIKSGTFWPVRGANWDALAILTRKDGCKELLLFEAKAHIGELIHGKDSKEWCEESKSIIIKSLSKTIGKYSTKSAEAWLSAYQFSNRIAYAQHLNECGIRTCVVYVLYNNDSSFKDKAVPGDPKRNWMSELYRQYNMVGIGEEQTQKLSCIYRVVELDSPTKEQLEEAGIEIESSAYKY